MTVTQEAKRLLMTPQAIHEPLGRWFTAEQSATLAVLVDDIIPADDFPGAIEAGVLAYLARLFNAELRERVADYRAALTALDDEARARHGLAYRELSSGSRSDLLGSLEENVVRDGGAQDGAAQEGGARGEARVVNHELCAFFRDLCARVAEGYYADPEQGGNRDGISWRMIGFTPS